MKTLLVKHIHTLVTMDEARRELRDAAMLIRGPAIERIASSTELEHLTADADEVLDLKGRSLVLPGLVIRIIISIKP
jgi:8-oxoguanine deaminase